MNKHSPGQPQRKVNSGSNLHQQVLDDLGQLVVGAAYGPGALVPNEEELVTRFGVSRTVVREAIRALGAKGLLESRPRSGTRVRPRAQWSLFDADVLRWVCNAGVDREFMLHLAQVRNLIEPSAAALAASTRTTAQLAAMQQAFRAMSEAADLQAWVRADMAFHDAILQATNNPLLISLGAVVGSALESLLVVNAREAGNFNEALPLHGKVLRAIERQRAEDAMLWMRAMLVETDVLILNATYLT